MVDSRLPSRWLHDPRIDLLSDAAWRVFTYSLMLANEQGSDGFIARSQLRFLHPEAVTDSAVEELLRAALWSLDEPGFRVLRWSETQTTAAALAAQRERSRETSRKHRAAKGASTSGPAVTGDVTGHALGKERKGQARTGEAEDLATEHKADLRLLPTTTGWPVARVPVPCCICSEPIDEDTPYRLCPRQDSDHARMRLALV
jgi:hypothetical protein